MRLALIGNGQVDKDYSTFIDSCDLVIRCNEAKNIGINTGTKTDILCISNTGFPARRIIKNKSVERKNSFSKIQKIWFPRDTLVHVGWVRRFNIEHPQSELVDLSKFIVTSNSLQDVPINHFSFDFNEKSFLTLFNLSKQLFVCPSTGFMTFFYITQQCNFDCFEKYIFGFNFKIWSGHPILAEKLYFRSMISSRKDIKFLY